MFEYGTKPAPGEPQSARAMRRGFLVLSVLTGIWCISGGLTLLGLSNLGMGIGLGLLELGAHKAHR